MIKQLKPAEKLSERRILARLVTVELKRGLDSPHSYGPGVIDALDTTLPAALEYVLQGGGVLPANAGIHPEQVLRLV